MGEGRENRKQGEERQMWMRVVEERRIDEGKAILKRRI